MNNIISPAATRGAGSTGVERQSSARPAILMVDDKPARLLTYEAILTGLEVRCVRALSGEEALQRLLAEEFAVILLDVHMPGMDGFEVARLLREHPRLERTPIIFVTGERLSEFDRLKGYEVGAIDYIPVPVVPEILRSKVAILVELHQRRAELRAVNSALAGHDHTPLEIERRIRAVFDHPSELLVVLEAERNSAGDICDWIYRDANANAWTLLGLTREKLIGRRLSEVLGQAATRPHELCKQVRETRELTRYEAEFQDRHLLVTVFPIADDCVVSSAVDITDRKRIETALRHSEERLREIDRRKDEFLAMLAHELRNPVAPILNVAEVLSRQLAGDVRQQSLVGIVQRQAAHLSRLLDDLLDVARITRGRIELKRELVPLAACVELALETADPLIKEKGHRLFIEPAVPGLVVNADRVRIAQCVTNLLSNAAKYTDPGGEIRLRQYVDQSQAVIEVSDTGMGISAQFLPHVFDLFAQGERALDRAQGGLGIGLSVCKRLLEKHGGSIAAHSNGAGKGSMFSIRLPLATEQTRAHVVSSSASTPRRRVLIVDDNHDAADSLAILLGMEGHEVRTAYSGEDALAQSAAADFEVVLLDIGLPGMNGYEVARRLKAAGSRARIVAQSGYGQPEDKQRAAAAGFHAHLVKPVEMAALANLLAETPEPVANKN